MIGVHIKTHTTAATRGPKVPIGWTKNVFLCARVEPQSGVRQSQDSGTEYWKFTARTMQIPVFRTWILRLSANLSRKFTRFSAWILTLSGHCGIDFRLSESWGLDIMHDWRFNQFSVFSALNLEIGRDEILDWRAAYYVNFGDVIDSSAVLMTWSIWRLKWSTRLQFCGLSAMYPLNPVLGAT